eukprot:COSAG04_NODE_12805_length_634_cov_0.996262_1_plen_104_part_01
MQEEQGEQLRGTHRVKALHVPDLDPRPGREEVDVPTWRWVPTITAAGGRQVLDEEIGAALARDGEGGVAGAGVGAARDGDEAGALLDQDQRAHAEVLPDAVRAR